MKNPILTFLTLGSLLISTQTIATPLNTLNGELELVSRHHQKYLKSGECYGTGAFQGLHEGTRVTVYNEKQEIIGVGSIQKSRTEIYEPQNYPICVLSYKVKTPQANFYTIEIGNKKLNYSHQELQNKNWEIWGFIYSK